MSAVIIICCCLYFMSYIGLLTAYGLAIIPRTLPHLKKYGGFNEMMKWSTLTPAEKCDFKKFLTSEERSKKIEVYDDGKTTVFALTGVKSGSDWEVELIADVDDDGINKWLKDENNCVN